jgi:hypothetical protein
MKKILFVLLVLFIANVGCKKTGIDGGGLCACSPVAQPTMAFLIKDANGIDLLNPKTTGYFEKSQIQLYAKDSNNTIKQLNFDIRQPFSYTSNLTVSHYQIRSSEIMSVARPAGIKFYLKLGDTKLYEIDLKVNNYFVEKVTVDNVELNKEYPSIQEPSINNIYSIKI